MMTYRSRGDGSYASSKSLPVKGGFFTGKQMDVSLLPTALGIVTLEAEDQSAVPPALVFYLF